MSGGPLRHALLKVTGLLLLVAAAASQVHAWTGSDAPSTYYGADTASGGPVSQFSALSPGSGWTCGVASGDDMASANVAPATFSFPYYGAMQSSVYLTTNGYLTFGVPATAYSTAGVPIPSAGTPNNVVLGNMEDLSVSGAARLCYKSLNAGSTTEALYGLWENVPHLSGTNPVNFVIMLFESDGVIEVHYGSSTADPDGSPENAGIENAGGSVGVSYNNVNLAPSGTAVQYRPAGVFPTATGETYLLDVLGGYGSTIIVDGAAHGAQTAMPKVLANDVAVHNAPLAATWTSAVTPAGPSLTTMSGGACTATVGLSADGSFCFTASTCGSYTFTYRADDAFPDDATAPLQDTATVTVDVINCGPGNQPTARADPYNVVPGTTSTYYQATEDLPLSVLATYPPAGSPFGSCGAGSGLLCDDDDPDSGETSTLLVHAPYTDTTGLAGTLANVDASNTLAKGAFLYTPTANACGAQQFTYRAKDTSGMVSVTQKAYIWLACAHDAPVASGDSYTVNEGTTLTVTTNSACSSGVNYDLLCNDTDADTNDIDTTATAGIKDTSGPKDKVMVCTQPAHGTVAVSAAQATGGGFTYTPNAGADMDWYGTQTFTYKVRDGRTDTTVDSPCATVTLTVSAVADAPVAVADTYSLVPDAGWTDFTAPPGLMVNDYDPDNLAPTLANAGLTVVNSVPAVTCPGAGGAGATITNWSTAGSFTFNPPTSGTYVGTCTFQYRVTDAVFTSGFATVSLQVYAPNKPFAGNDLCTTNEDIAVATPVGSCASATTNDLKFTGTTPTFALVTAMPAAQGTVTVTSAGAYTFAPAANFFGTTQFTYRFQQVNPANGQLTTSNDGVVRITINSVNDPPSATPKSYSLNEDCTTVAASSCAAPYFVASAVCTATVRGLLCEAAGYDADPNDNPNNTPITVVVPSPAPSMATPMYTPKGKVVSLSTTGAFTYIPNPHAYGTDTFTFQVRDSGGTANGGVNTSPAIPVTLTINPILDPPVALPDPCVQQFLTAGVPYLPSCPAGSQTKYKAWYGHTLMAPASVNGVLANDYDPDNFPSSPLSNAGLTVDCGSGMCTLNAPIGVLTVEPDGTFAYVPPAAPLFGTACTQLSFQYRALDVQGPSAPVTAKIELCPNPPPVALFSVVGGNDHIAVGQSVSFQDQSSDPGGAVVSWMWSFGDGLSSSTQNPTHEWTHTGTYAVSLRATDAVGDFNDFQRTVVVDYLPDPVGADDPTGTALVALAGPDQVVLPGTLVHLDGTLSRADQASYAWTQTKGPSVATVTALGGHLTLRAPDVPAGQRVVLAFRLDGQAGGIAAVPDEVQVIVQPANAAPLLSLATHDADVGDVVQLDGRATTDPDGDILEFGWTQVSGVPVQLQDADGTLATFTVPADAAGTDLVFTAFANDGEHVSEGRLTVHVHAPPAPIDAIRVDAIGPDGTVRVHSRLTAERYRWSFDDGTTRDGPDASRRLDEGRHTIRLELRSAGTTTAYDVTVDVPQHLAAPPLDAAPAAGGKQASSPALVSLLAGLGAALVAARRRT